VNCYVEQAAHQGCELVAFGEALVPLSVLAGADRRRSIQLRAPKDDFRGVRGSKRFSRSPDNLTNLHDGSPESRRRLSGVRRRALIAAAQPVLFTRVHRSARGYWVDPSQAYADV